MDVTFRFWICNSVYYKAWPNLSGVNEASFSFPICIYSGVLSILLIGLNLHSKLFSCGITNMWVASQYGLWSFQMGGSNLERFLHKNQHTQRKLLNFKNWVDGEVKKSAKIWLSKSIFYVKNYLNLSQFFFSLKNINLGAHFLLLKFFDKIIF